MDFKKDSPAFARLLGEMKTGQPAHTFVIEGKDEKSRRDAAMLCAAALDCECTEREEIPCGRCSSCSKIISGRHPDVTFVGGEDGAKVSVDEIRRVRSDVFQSAFEAENKIVIFNGAHLLSAQAQNALLKILEEPPQKVYFILTCPSSNMLLPTVSSRCAKYSLGELGKEEIYNSVSELCKNIGDNEKKRYSNVLLMLDGFEMTEKNIDRLAAALEICDKFYGDGVFPFELLPVKKEESEALKLTFKILALCALEVIRAKKGVAAENPILKSNVLSDSAARLSLRSAYSQYELFTQVLDRLLTSANLSAVTALLRTELA